MRYGHIVRAVAALALISAASIASGQNSPIAAGTLAIQTTPAEATVIVDGEVRGTSPLVLPGLAAGRHRVVIKRAGFLENSADVEVTAGRTVTLDRTLTPATPEPRTGTGRASPPTQNAPAPPPRESPPPRQSPQRPTPVVTRSGSGNGGKKWALVAVAGGAAAGAAAAAQANKNEAPIPGTISISPSGTGMAAFTNFTMRSAGASDKDKDSLTFNWTFGDNGTASGQSVTHIYARTGTYSVALTVDDGKQTSHTPAATVTVGPSLAGTWTGGTVLMPNTVGLITVSCPISLTLNQGGTTLTGSLTFVSGCFGSLSLGTGSTPAALTHPAGVAFGAVGPFTFNGVPNLFLSFSGSTNAAGTNMSATMTLTRPSTGGVSTSSTSFTKSS